MVDNYFWVFILLDVIWIIRVGYFLFSVVFSIIWFMVWFFISKMCFVGLVEVGKVWFVGCFGVFFFSGFSIIGSCIVKVVFCLGCEFSRIFLFMCFINCWVIFKFSLVFFFLLLFCVRWLKGIKIFVCCCCGIFGFVFCICNLIWFLFCLY